MRSRSHRSFAVSLTAAPSLRSRLYSRARSCWNRRTKDVAGGQQQPSLQAPFANGISHTVEHVESATRDVARHGHERPAARRHPLQALVDVYDGDTYRLLADMAQLLGASVAYVDRPTIEAHLERSLSDPEWAAVTDQLSAMAFDEHIGEAGSFRTDWIEDVLARAGVPGRSHTADGEHATAHPRRRS